MSSAERASLGDRALTWLLLPLPQHLFSRLVLYLSRRRSRLRLPVMRWFVRRYRVDMHEAADPDLASYACFNAFFTRALKPGARPLASGEDSLCAPADGRVSQLGRIRDGRILQAKGCHYSVLELLAGRGDLAEAFRDGGFATVYLSPRDYHRVHMPMAGRLRCTLYVPGRLFSVAPHTVRALPGLFARNERVIAVFDTARGPLAMALVGAINVAAIETVWSGLVTPPRGQRVHCWEQPAETPLHLDKGAEMGRFNLGSTVILLLPRGLRWREDLGPGRALRMGEAMGHWSAGSEA